MYTFHLDEVAKLGTKDPKFGQKYWCKSMDVDLPISFNSNLDLEITEANPRIHIGAEEKTTRTSTKGTEYIQLKKVTLLERGGSNTQTMISTPTVTNASLNDHQVVLDNRDPHTETMKALRAIYSRLGDIYEAVSNNSITEPEEPATEPPKTAEDVFDVPEDNEPVNLDDIPF